MGVTISIKGGKYMAEALLDHIHYFRIPVIDLQASIKWYTDHLGFSKRFHTDELSVMELSSGPLLVLVTADKESRGHFTINGQPAFSIGFTTSNIAKLHEQLSFLDVQVEPIKEDNGHHYFYFYDLNGNKLQVHN